MQNSLAAALAELRATVQAIHDAYPGLSDDDLADTIEGQRGSFEDAIFASLRSAIEREAAADALGSMIETMGKRKSRLAEGAQALRAAALRAMQEAMVPKLSQPDMSVSIGAGRPSVVIPDPAAVPDIYCRVKREPDKKLIAEVIKSGANPSWATLNNGPPTLTVRRT